MPVLKDTRKVAKTSILSIEGSEVEIYDSLLVGDADEVVHADLSDFQRMIRALAKMIKSWNLTDEDGNELPVSTENIGKLTFPDVEHLVKQTSYGVELGKTKVSPQR